MNLIQVLLILLCLAFTTTAFGQTDSDYPTAARINSIWQIRVVPVCWEQDPSGVTEESGWVEEAIESTWERYGNIDFVGWQRCPSVARAGQGIRISVQDINPHVKALGRFLDGGPGGMVLNFTFNNFSKGCRSTREVCIRAIAVHEFGHALGIAHEQNRPDAPEWCREQAQGTGGDWLVTQYDTESIMNYCSPNWNNDGVLSELDKEGIRSLYPRYTAPDVDPRAWYKMVTRVSDQCLHVQNANGKRRNALWQWSCGGGDQFLFQFEPTGNGYYRIRSRYGKCFHVRNGPNRLRRKELWQWECKMNDHFLFELLKTEDGWYKIKSKAGMCFHVRGGPSRTLREPLWSWECVNQPHFYFYFERV